MIRALGAGTAEALAPFVEESAEVPRLPLRAYQALRRAIRELKLAPGQMVLEKDAAALGISRTPIREAFVRLEDEGLLQLVPRHGFSVAPLDAASLQEIYELLEG